MYDLGIIGGMGSKATATLFDLIVDNTLALNDQEHLDIIVLNKASFPDRTKSILTGKVELLETQLKETVKQLNGLGVKNIAIPCNTTHFLFNDLQAVSNANIINMVQKTLEYVALSGATKKVCVLGTLGTVRSKIYEVFNVFGLEVCYPDDELCAEIQEVIYDIKDNKSLRLEELSLRLKNIIDRTSFKDDKTTYILACTELSLLDKKVLKEYNIVDALEVLVLLSIAKSGKLLAENKLCYNYDIIKNMI